MVTSNIFIDKKCFYLLNFTDLYWIFRMDWTQVTKKRCTFKCCAFFLLTVTVVLSGVFDIV